MDASSQLEFEKRMGDNHFGRRILLQAEKTAIRITGGHSTFYWEHAEGIHKALTLALKLTGLTGWAKANTLKFELAENKVILPNLPAAFEGYRILQLSDLHIDHMPDNGQRLAELVRSQSFDLCVLTGDYRFHTDGTDDEAVDGMLALLPALQCVDGIVGILGNHDYLEIAAALENLGINMLLNESRQIQRGDDRLSLIGVDDPHYYRVDDLARAMRHVNARDIKLLLAHSPEIIDQAAERDIDIYLSGHTHGGQVCLPGSIPLITNARCARRYVQGAWQYQSLQGYTSRGVGSSGVDARVFCPPEIVIHELRCSS
jgi:predicted MPP superfamily phosphohydrolase